MSEAPTKPLFARFGALPITVQFAAAAVALSGCYAGAEPDAEADADAPRVDHRFTDLSGVLPPGGEVTLHGFPADSDESTYEGIVEQFPGLHERILAASTSASDDLLPGVTRFKSERPAPSRWV